MISDQIALHSVQLPLLIVSITKFLIVIGSPGAYLSRSRGAITLVYNYRYPISTVLDTHVIHTSIPRSLMASFGMFPTVSKTYEKRYICFAFSLKRSSQKTFLIPKFVIDTIN